MLTQKTYRMPPACSRAHRDPIRSDFYARLQVAGRVANVK